MKRTFLWLDDLRDPWTENWALKYGINITYNDNIVWVKDFDEFKKYLESNQMPHQISFDHDLADEHYTPEDYWDNYQKSKQYQERQTYTEKTGYDCAKWLCDYCAKNNIDLPITTVHSANPVGADNIRKYISSYRKNEYLIRNINQ